MKAALRVAILFGTAAAAAAGDGRWTSAGPPGSARIGSRERRTRRQRGRFLLRSSRHHLPAQAYWNGSPRPARLVPPTVCPGFCPPTILVVSVTANDIASPGAALVTVVNPSPGGGAADPFRITIAPVPPREAIRPDAPKVPREPRPLPPRSER